MCLFVDAELCVSCPAGVGEPPGAQFANDDGGGGGGAELHIERAECEVVNGLVPVGAAGPDGEMLLTTTCD